MTLTTVQLWERLASSGLANTEDCRSWALAVAEQNADDLHDTNRLLSQLIQLGKLTPFQANVLVRNIPIPLSIGQFRVTQSLEKEIGKNWFAAIDCKSKQPTSRWLFLLTPDFLGQSLVQKHPPSLRLTKKYVGLQHPALDQWQFIDTIGEHIAAVCHAIPGKSLNKILAERTMTMDEAAAMISNIASGLGRLHENGLVHGNISGSSVWQQLNQTFVLRTDPLFPPTNPYVVDSGDITNWDENFKLAFAAPELTLPGWQPTCQTDLYALGCLWYQAVTGRLLFADTSESNGVVWAKRHCTDPLPKLDSVSSNDQLARCLSHLLAKNPSARFANCDELIRAIDQSLPAPVPAMGTRAKPDKAALVFAVLEKPKNENDQVANKDVGSLPKSLHSATGVPTNERTVIKQTSSAAIPSRNKGNVKVKRKKPMWFFPGIVLGSLGIIGIIMGLLLRNPPQANTTNSEQQANNNTQDSTTKNTNASPTVNGSSEDANSHFAVVQDDGKLLYTPRHYGAPCSLHSFPAGLEAVAFISGNVWKQEGPWNPIGKWWLDINPESQKALAIEPGWSEFDIDSVAIGVYASDKPGEVQLVKRIELASAVAIGRLAGHLKQFRLERFDANDANHGIWIQNDGSQEIACVMQGLQTNVDVEVRSLAIGPPSLLKTLKELPNGVAPVHRQIELLIENTDHRNDLSLIFLSKFARGDGKGMLTNLPGAESILSEVLGNQVAAIAMTTDLEGTWYGELRMYLEDARENSKLIATLRQRIDQFAASFEAHLVHGTTSPYWKSIALRYPQMLRGVSKHLRTGIEENQIIGNLYLPQEAAKNLMIAAWMSMRDPLQPGPTNAVASKSGVNTTSQKSIQDILNSPISVAFEQESLESALGLIASEVADSVLGGKPIPIVINYDAFKKDGITQNQQIRDFKKSSMPLRGVMTDLVRRANPITTVQATTEEDQKVVWVVQDSTEGVLKKKIELTTRSWAKSHNTPLPPEFASP